MSPQSSIAHYRITSKLGEGGMGEVWRATDTKLGRDVAIKILPDAFAADADRMARFTREAHLLASLNHPNIAIIHGVEERALVMELVDGPTLAERIAAGAIPIDEALSIARQIAEALEYAHQRSVIHRDLKPTNIKITPEGRAKVLDFGLARALGDQPATGDPGSSPTLTMGATMAGVILGTAAYMSPEQAHGKIADHRVDIWSFGVVLYEMLAGKMAFIGESISDTVASVLKSDPDWNALPAGLPAEIQRLLRQCLRKDRQKRLQSMGDARVAIEDAQSGSAEVETSAAPRIRRGAARWWVAIIAVMAIALAALSAVHFREAQSEPSTVRFQIPRPGGGISVPDLALSPDGRKLAFRAVDAAAKIALPMLWIRTLDSLEAYRLPGTEGASELSWSPDGRSLAFEAGSKLKRIDVSGGPPQILCDVGAPRGVDWNRDGFIYFGNGGIYRVPQSGGEPVALTKPSTGEGAHAFPQVLPDGRHFLYLSLFSRQPDSIYLATLDGKEKKRLVTTSTRFRYAPPSENGKPGHLLFLREDTLMALPLHANTFALAGDAFRVVERVASSLNEAFFTASNSGTLAYMAGTSYSGSWLRWFDRSGKSLGDLGEPGNYNNLALSHDGKRAAIVWTDPRTANRDIWLFDVARRIRTRFTFHEAQEWDPVWSPDNSRIVFSSNREGNYNLYVKDSSGVGDEERLQNAQANERPCDWSSDGQYLMYTRGSRGSSKLWVLSQPLGDPAKRKTMPYLDTQFDTGQCQFSPDGRWVAYTSDESKHGFEVYVQSFPPGAGKFQVSNAGGVQPRWRRDGRELFYVSADGKLMAVDVKTTASFEAGIPHALFDPSFLGGSGGMFVFRYDVTPDGQRFLVNTLGQSEAAAPETITVVLNWQAGFKR
jgi:Tol biopolymer transport system component